ncbi:angiopoietin-4 [Aplysia californica]|uniref:Angiopoietin-4 n=1 Tax=Aplysia californica TaxID=6500 RepID=A0ABM1A7A1_APLCA|nr:angiopoietin-4 [Aplysia californica]
MDAIWVSGNLILAAALSLSSNACVLNVTTSEVNVGKTANVSLKCFTPDHQHDISELIMLRILKWDHNKWSSVAKLQRGDDIEVKNKTEDALADGRISTVADSFLWLTWPVATYNTIGQYLCDAVSSTLQESVTHQKSLPVIITSNSSNRVFATQVLGETLQEYNNRRFLLKEQDEEENMAGTVEAHEEVGFDSKLRNQVQTLSHMAMESNAEYYDPGQLNSPERQILEKIQATAQRLETYSESDLNGLDDKNLKTLKVASEVNENQCPQQKQNATAIFEALQAGFERKLKVVKHLLQPQMCADVQGLGPRPVVLLHQCMVVTCDTVTDNGGWIVIQRRASADVDFFRGWVEYKHGFDDLSGNFLAWVGKNPPADKAGEIRTGVRFDI